MKRFTVGGYDCISLDAGQFTIGAARLFANASPEDRAAAVEKYGLDAEGVLFRVSPLWIDTGANRVLIDPGSSDEPDRLLAGLQAAGLDPAEVDTVMITHGHADHYSGCVKDGGPTLPNARYHLMRAEWDHWLAPDNPEPNHAEIFSRLLPPIRDRFTLLEGSGEIVPGIEAVATPGHSPGHMAVRIGGQMMCVGDVLLNPVHVEHPDWYGGFDVWPDQVVQARRALLRRIVDEKLLVATYHFGVGRIAPAGAGWEWVPEP